MRASIRNVAIGLAAIALAGCEASGGAGGPMAPRIVTQPRSTTVMECEGATFEVVVSGSALVTYRWLADGVEIPGANGRTLALPRVGPGSDGRRFRVVVSSEAGEVTSEEAILTVASADGPRVLADDLVFAGLVADAEDVFWTNGLGVAAAPVDCDRPIRTIYDRASPGETVYALSLADETLVWTDYVAGTVKAARTDGSALRTVAAGLSVGLSAVVSDAQRAYWSRSSGAPTLDTAPLSGDGPVTALAPGPIDSWALALDDEYVYALDWPETLLRISRADGAVTVLAGALSYPTGLAVARGHVYWTETLGHDTDAPVGLVRRVSRDGGEPVRVASHAGQALVLATDATHAYWTIRASERDPTGAVARAPLDASGEVEILASGLDGPFHLTLAGTLVVWRDGQGIRAIPKPPATGAPSATR